MLSGLTYPGMVPSPGDSTSGVLYVGLGGADWRALDAFESEEYERVRVVPVAASGASFPAQTYLIPETYRHRVTDVPWDRARFERLHMHELVASRPTPDR